MSFQPVVARPKPVDVGPIYVSFSPSGGMRLCQALRHQVEDLDHTHLEVEYDAVDQRLRFKSGLVGLRVRYNTVSVPKDIVKTFTLYSDYNIHRNRRHLVELNADGWWYVIKSPSRLVDSYGVGKNKKHS